MTRNIWNSPYRHVELAETSSRQAHTARCLWQKGGFTRKSRHCGNVNPRSAHVFHGRHRECNFPLSSGVFPITVPPCKGTHGDRVAGDNTRSRHNLRHFSYCATSPAWQLRNRTPRILVLSVKSDARCGRRRCGSKSVFKLVAKVFRTRLHAFA